MNLGLEILYRLPKGKITPSFFHRIAQRLGWWLYSRTNK
jgi:hypothetical protein